MSGRMVPLAESTRVRASTELAELHVNCQALADIHRSYAKHTTLDPSEVPPATAAEILRVIHERIDELQHLEAKATESTAHMRSVGFEETRVMAQLELERDMTASRRAAAAVAQEELKTAMNQSLSRVRQEEARSKHIAIRRFKVEQEARQARQELEYTTRHAKLEAT